MLVVDAGAAGTSSAVPTPHRVASMIRHWLALILTRLVRALHYVVAFRSKSMNSAASSGLANMMVRSSSWIMRP